MDFGPKAPPRSELRFCATRESCDFTPPGTGRERHRRHRVNLLRRSSAGAAVLADDTPPTAPKRLIMARSGLLARLARQGGVRGGRTRRGGGNRRVRCRRRPGSGLWRALTRTKSGLSGESPSDSPQSATEGGLEPTSGDQWRQHDVHDDDRQVCGYVLLSATRVASLGIWTALSKTRTPWRSIWDGSCPGRAPKRPSSWCGGADEADRHSCGQLLDIEEISCRVW